MMTKKQFAWILGRALIMSGLAVAYARTSPAVSAACYTTCTGDKDYKGNCIAQSCNQGGGKGVDTCVVNTDCWCTFSGASCGTDPEG